MLFRLAVGIKEAEVWTDVNEVTVHQSPFADVSNTGWCLECEARTISMNYWVRCAAV